LSKQGQRSLKAVHPIRFQAGVKDDGGDWADRLGPTLRSEFVIGALQRHDGC
jgi:hypothetical protein